LAPADPSLTLYMAHRADLLNYANSIVRDRASAEDLVQEAWLRFSSRAAHSAEISQPTSYLYSIVRNLALDWLRRASRNPALPATAQAIEAVASDAPSAERVLYYRDELRVFDEVLAQLPARTQRALILYRFEKRTLQEIADELGVSVARVHTMIKQAMLFCALRIKGTET
jgi:RNA polymerase sigma factor (sigma-70 family)